MTENEALPRWRDVKASTHPVLRKAVERTKSGWNKEQALIEAVLTLAVSDWKVTKEDVTRLFGPGGSLGVAIGLQRAPEPASAHGDREALGGSSGGVAVQLSDSALSDEQGPVEAPVTAPVVDELHATTSRSRRRRRGWNQPPPVEPPSSDEPEQEQ